MSDARGDLLARALSYYAEHGIRDTSLRTLATAIGTSQRMLHYHFGSREDLLRAVIDAVAGQQAEQIAERFAATVDPFEAGRRNWEETVQGAALFGPLWFELATHAMRKAPYAAGLADVMVQSQLREFTRVYAAHTDEAHAQRLARLTLAVGQGLIFDLLIDDDREGADEAIDEFTDMVSASLELRQ